VENQCHSRVKKCKARLTRRQNYTLKLTAKHRCFLSVYTSAFTNKSSFYFNKVQTENENAKAWYQKWQKISSSKKHFPIKILHCLKIEGLFKNKFLTIPQLILGSEEFKSFETVIFIVHQKGMKSCSACIYENKTFTEFQVSTSLFNRVSKTIKKSKKNVFAQNDFKTKKIPIIGNTFAFTNSLSNYNTITFLTRNDFLPFSENDVESFSYLKTVFESLVTPIIKVQHINFNEKLLKEVINQFPTSINISTKSGDKHFYSNKSWNNKDAEVPIKGIYHLSSNKDLIFSTATENNEDLISDIHHFNRISLLGELLNTLKHELSNPLFGLKLYCDMLEADTGDIELKESLQDISFNVQRCNEIIEMFSKLYTDKNQLEVVSLKKIINESLTLAKSEIRFLKKNVLFHQSLNDDPILINTNPTWITQILFNLLINSAQAINNRTGKKSFDILITVEKNFDDSIIEITVDDAGPGIDPNILENLFKPFCTSKKSGTGLGLAICKNLSQKLSGNLIHLGAGTLGGSSFVLKLPINMEDNYECTNN